MEESGMTWKDSEKELREEKNVCPSFDGVCVCVEGTNFYFYPFEEKKNWREAVFCKPLKGVKKGFVFMSYFKKLKKYPGSRK